MDITRRDALLAVAAASMSASEAPAANEQGEARKLLQLRIVLPDGQTVDLRASELVVDFGGTGKLAVKPEGVLPVVEIAAQRTFEGAPFNPPQQRTQPQSKPFRGTPPTPLDDLNSTNP